MAPEIPRRLERLILFEFALEFRATVQDAFRRAGANIEYVYVAYPIFIASLRGEPGISLSKISLMLKLPRTTLERRLKPMLDSGLVVKRGRLYALSDKVLQAPDHAGLERNLAVIKRACAALSEIKNI